ncbi:DUF6520 family protein [Flavivirga eckloniae]|uniref:Uncharacterized protein n=1 Tax=Flavivirga eckloniae TaxID=1803846 RepID=A0A2K9PMK4_9FLAO|nr:DUF6520 family protein [Flavivirga eckloniae]AUP78280.1 hypothetical protein C1H87_05945 [Flavivirga eckloniae]
MKSKIFKIVLPAITLIFAITASLAFTANEALTDGWYLDSNEECLFITPPEECDITGDEDCTMFIFGTGPNTIIHQESQCLIPLKRPAQ